MTIEKNIYLQLAYLYTHKQQSKKLHMKTLKGERRFEILESDDLTLLIESKTNRAMTTYTKAYRVDPIAQSEFSPSIREYITPEGDNLSATWTH